MYFLDPTTYTLVQFNADPRLTNVNAPTDSGASGQGYGVYGTAVDLDARKVWHRSYLGNWFDIADPATGVLPSYTYPAQSNPILPVFFVRGGTDSYGTLEDHGKVIFDSAEWTWAAPEGFGVWTAG